jgi:DEAD/DEAH box helicase domain-containing protein
MDTLVFDIETQNFFTDPDVGWDNFEALKISAVGVYSYDRDEYVCFEEGEMEKAAVFFRNAGRLIGFSSNRYDVPVLHLYFQRLPGDNKVDLWAKERVDLLEKIERAAGFRVSLSKLAQANLGVGKDRHGAEAIGLYKRGEIEELKKYCLKDVELTKQLYDRYRNEQFLMVPNLQGEPTKITFHDVEESRTARLPGGTPGTTTGFLFK